MAPSTVTAPTLPVTCPVGGPPSHPLPVQLPIGSEDSFRGVVDLVEMRAILWHDDLGTKMTEEEIDRARKQESEDRSRDAEGKDGRP